MSIKAYSNSHQIHQWKPKQSISYIIYICVCLCVCAPVPSFSSCILMPTRSCECLQLHLYNSNQLNFNGILKYLTAGNGSEVGLAQMHTNTRAYKWEQMRAKFNWLTLDKWWWWWRLRARMIQWLAAMRLFLLPLSIPMCYSGLMKCNATSTAVVALPLTDGGNAHFNRKCFVALITVYACLSVCVCVCVAPWSIC